MTDPPAPLISVIVPCWNARASIARALESVLELQSVPLECVVVDDGSTDGTADVVRELAATDPRVRLIALPENAGVSNARNRGLEAVRGTWLTMLDADDRFLPGGPERLVAAARTGDALAVVGQQVWFDGSRSWIGSLYDIPDIREPGRKSLVSHPGLLYYVSPHAKLIHRSCWEGLRFSGRVLGDQPWVIRALMRAGDRIDVIGDTVYEWYRPATGEGPGSITARTRATARRGVEAAAVAGEALASVTEEAEGRLDAAPRERLLGAYVERLLRSDLGVHLANALGRGDPTIGELVDAIARFVGATPPHLLAASGALAVDIVEPPLKRWHRVNRAGRTAYRRLLAAAVAADADVISRTTSLRARIVLHVMLRTPGPLGSLAADGVLAAARVLGGIERRVRPGSR